MKRLPSLWLLVALLFSACTTAPVAQAPHTAWLNPADVPLRVLLAPPPLDGSARQRADLAVVLDAQRARTPAEAERARADSVKSVFRFADVLGPNFNAANLPKTAALFAAAGRDAEAVAKNAKHYFRRARPFIASRDVHPCVPVKPGDAYDSYPSGHATFGYMSAILLAQMVPEKRAALFARGREFGENRIIAGVHYPDDVEAGRIDGTVIAAALLADPAFRQAFAAAKAETRAALALD